MLPAERQQEILTQVRSNLSVKAEELAAQFDVSVETVRRDLRQLADKGLLERVYGGAAMPLVSSEEASFDSRANRFSQEKKAIATAAVELLGAGETILIDVGTTCHLLAKAIPLTWTGRVVTNSVLVAAELAGRASIELVLAGGSVRAGDLACSGHQTVAAFAEFNYAAAFVASGAVHPNAGLTDYHAEEAELRRSWLPRVGRAYVLADASKLGGVAPCRVSPLDRFAAVITDDRADLQELQKLADEGVLVHVVQVQRSKENIAM